MNYKKSFLDYLQFEKRYSDHTILSYRTDLEQFERHFYEQAAGSDLGLASVKVIRSWVIRLMESGKSARSVNRKISTLKSFYKFMVREQHVTINPMDKVLSPKLSKKLPSFVEEDKMDLLLDTFEFGEDFSGYRNRLIIARFKHAFKISNLFRIMSQQILRKIWSNGLVKHINKNSVILARIDGNFVNHIIAAGSFCSIVFVEIGIVLRCTDDFHRIIVFAKRFKSNWRESIVF